DALAHTKQTELTIVASMTIAEHLLPGWIGAFRSLHPGLHTKLKVMNSSEVIETVEQDKGELGFVETPELPDSLQSTPVWDDQLVAVVGPTHPWAHQPPELTASQLANTALIKSKQGSGTRACIDLFVGVDRPKPLKDLTTNVASSQGASEGIGAAVLSRLAVRAHLRTGHMIRVPISGQPLERSLRAVWQRRTGLSAGAKAFIQVARDSAEDND